MDSPDFIFVTGCNAAGKSTLIRTRLNEFPKNVSKYFPYFDESFFLYTGEKGTNELIMRFQRDSLVEYKSNDFQFVQKFGEYAHSLQRLEQKDLDIIIANKAYKADFMKNVSNKGVKWI